MEHTIRKNMNKLLKIKSIILTLCLLLFLLLNISPSIAETNESKLLIYNAASTADIIIEIAKEWENLNSIKVRSSSASSSALAKQLLNGAPANIYISASWLWIEELKKQNIIKVETIKPIFENRLVLIAHKNSPIKNIGLINSKIKLAYELSADGVHLNSKQIHDIDKFPKDLIVGASCHNMKDLDAAEKKGANFAVLSPINKTLSHPKASSIGWDTFSSLAIKYTMPIYALGGMTLKDVKRAQSAGGIGVASQRDVWNN